MLVATDYKIQVDAVVKDLFSNTPVHACFLDREGVGLYYKVLLREALP